VKEAVMSLSELFYARSRARQGLSGPAKRRRRRSRLPSRQTLLLEPLENRLLLSVDFVAGAPVAPTNRADVGLPTLPLLVVEPAVSINPTDPGNVIVSSQTRLQASTNEGGTFAVAQGFANVPGQTGNSGDTDTAFDSQGRLFWVNLVNFAGQRDIVIESVNPTTGASLAVPARVPNGGFTDDKPFIGADANPLSPFADNLYVAWSRFGQAVAGQWSVYFSRSTDHGVTWSAPLLLSDFDGPNNVVDNGGDDEGLTWPADVKVAPNGDVYVAYHAQPDINEAELEGATPANPNGTSGKVFVLRSTDGGLTFPQKAEAFTDGQADVTYNRQSAGGLIPGTDFWTLGSPQPWLLPDPSHPGFIYVVSNDDPDNNHGNGDDANVVFARSGDNGLNWTRSTISSGPANSFQLLPTASIDEFGNIVVAWYDNRRGQTNDGPDNILGNADDNFLLDVFATYSTDGGLTWAPDFMVNDGLNEMDPDIGTVNRFTDVVGGANVITTRIGEYFGLEHFGGTAHVAWNGPNPLDPAVQTAQQVVYSTFAIRGQLTVTGDDSGAATDDLFTISRIAGNTDFIEVRVNGIRQYAGLLEGLTQIDIAGFGGNDTLTVDSTNGLISVLNGIRYNGGAGFDRLTLQQTGGATQTSDTYSVGPNPGEGTSVIVGPSGTQTVFFEDLAPVLDLVPAALLTVNATPSPNAINYTQGSVPANGLVTIDNFEPIEFSNKTALVINAGVSDDTVDLNNTATPAALATIAVNAGDGEDTVTTLAGLPTALNLDGGNGNDSLDASGATGPAILAGGSGNDVLIGGSGSDSISGGSGEDLIDGRGGVNTLNGGADTDTILVSGTGGTDLITTTHSGGSFNVTGGLSGGNNTISDIEAVRIEAGNGSDDIRITLNAAGGLNYTVLGGNPIGAVGDMLTLITGASVVFTPGPENDSGALVAATTSPTNVSFDEIEAISISGGPLVVSGTNGPDAITIIARDSSTHAGTDGVQDFTVAIDTSPEILFINTPSLGVNALGGSDEVVLRAPAPNNAVWNVQVTIDGGPPSASDTLVVETPGAAAETVVYTPNASDGGTLDLNSLTSLVTLTQIEHLLYDGEADGDRLTVTGTSSDDTFVHSPGAGNQAGAFALTALPSPDLLGLSYQNLGAAAVLAVAGADGNDTLVVNGTATNDSFTVNAAGIIALNSRVPIGSTGVEILTLEGLDGDDTFTLQAPVGAGPYTTVNLLGGAQASIGLDRAFLVGTAGADTFLVNGAAIGNITLAGVEDSQLNALAGSDVLVYNGVPGIVESIRLAASGAAGGGQLNVPGVVQITFTNLERVDVNGNTGASGDEDTLTFAGTNAADVFQIDLAAAGTDADPIAELQDGAGTTLLTLRNYTNFATLRVEGLEGGDTFNVFTDATGPNRNLFVDGGLPAGKKKQTDQLNIFYTPPRPHIIQSAATQEPEAGLVDLDYGTARYVVQYDGMEDFVIRRL
jgi:hemolysin type calcium-binding protein